MNMGLNYQKSVGRDNEKLFVERVGYIVQFGRIYAPHYRKASPSALLETNIKLQANILEIAVNDVIAAFNYYLQKNNNGKKIILVGHSQGSMMIMMLLRKLADNDANVRDKIFLVVLGGLGPGLARMFVNNNDLKGGWLENIPVCQELSDTGCIMSWVTWKYGISLPKISPFNMIKNDSLFVRGFMYQKYNATIHRVFEDNLGFSTPKKLVKVYFQLLTAENVAPILLI